MDLADLELEAGALCILMCLYVALKSKSRRRSRRFKIRPINRARMNRGNFHYYKKMKRWDAEQFFKFTRMTVPIFEELIQQIKPHIQKQKRRDGINAEERLILTLQYLSQGSSMQSLAWSFNIGLATVHTIIHETCRVLWNVLCPEYLQTPTTEEKWLSIAADYEEMWNFPHCLGSLDGKHISVQAPAHSGSLFYNYKKRFSIVLLATCNAKYEFTLVDIGAYGSQSDGGVLRNSIFGKRLEEETLNVPKPSQLGNCPIKIPYFFVADEAFPLKEYIMRPFPSTNLPPTERIFNYRLSRARNTIENAFGILVARWRILKTTINAKVENVDNIVKATIVLHNFCKIKFDKQVGNMYCPTGFVDSDGQQNGNWRNDENLLPELGRQGSNIAKKAIYRIRKVLAEYFTSQEGRVSWQEEVVNSGRQFQ